MKLFLLIFLFFQSFTQVFACTCVGETVRGSPKKYKDIQENLIPVGTAGWGYIVDRGSSKVFKFLACYNRKDCSDLILSNYEMKWYAATFKYAPSLTRVLSNFESFEEGLNSDLKYNVEVRKSREKKRTYSILESIRESIVESVFYSDCKCPEPEKVSLIWDDRSEVVRSDKIYPKSFNGEKVSVAHELEGCGCENIFTNNGFNLIKNLETSKSSYYKSDYNISGFFYEKEGNLFFKKIAVKDYMDYEDKVTRLKYNNKNQLPQKSDVLEYEKMKVQFYKEQEALGEDTISIKEKYKCNPIAKYILKQHVVISSEKPFDIVSNSIESLNLCHMTIKSRNHSPYENEIPR